VHLFGADFDQAKQAAREFAYQRGFHFVEDGAEPTICISVSSSSRRASSGSRLSWSTRGGYAANG
jgi:hypothetical protein